MDKATVETLETNAEKLGRELETTKTGIGPTCMFIVLHLYNYMKTFNAALLSASQKSCNKAINTVTTFKQVFGYYELK